MLACLLVPGQFRVTFFFYLVLPNPPLAGVFHQSFSFPSLSKEKNHPIKQEDGTSERLLQESLFCFLAILPANLKRRPSAGAQRSRRLL